MKKISHWNSTYIYNRFLLMRYERANPNVPWLTPQMNEVLDSLLQASDVGVEWGSGRSTLWFAKRVSHLISVEHDSTWVAQVKVMVKNAGANDKVDYISSPVSDKFGKIDAQARYGELADEYVNVLKKCKDESLDFALVDGVERDRCALACIDKLRSGGIVIVDNVNWYLPRSSVSLTPNSRSLKDGYASNEWEEFSEIVKGWRSVWTSSGVSDTALWVKP